MGDTKDNSPPHPVSESGRYGCLGKSVGAEKPLDVTSPPLGPATLNTLVRQGLEGERRLRASMELPFSLNFKTAVGGTNVYMFF